VSSCRRIPLPWAGVSRRFPSLCPLLAVTFLVLGPVSEPAGARSERSALPQTVVLKAARKPLASGEVRFTASTDTRLGGPGGLYVELRGFDLRRIPRPPLDKPDLARTGCLSSPCSFDVGLPSGSNYAFRAVVIDSKTEKVVETSRPLLRSWRVLPFRNVALRVNGKARPLVSMFSKTYDYRPIAAGPLRVEARWKGDARAKGYFIEISTTEPEEKRYARCTTGTSCRVAHKARIEVNQGMSWLVTFRRVDGTALDGYRLYLVGRG
jgi:hypothetical protein